MNASALACVPEISAESFLNGDVDAYVLDVRGEHEHRAGALEGSLNIPHTRLKPRLDSLPRDKPIVAHCKGGMRSAAATAFLRRQGFDVINLAGGYMALEKSGALLVKGDEHKIMTG